MADFVLLFLFLSTHPNTFNTHWTLEDQQVVFFEIAKRAARTVGAGLCGMCEQASFTQSQSSITRVSG